MTAIKCFTADDYLSHIMMVAGTPREDLFVRDLLQPSCDGLAHHIMIITWKRVTPQRHRLPLKRQCRDQKWRGTSSVVYAVELFSCPILGTS